MRNLHASLASATAALAILISAGAPATAQGPGAAPQGQAGAPGGRGGGGRGGGRGQLPPPKPGPVPRMPDGKPDLTGYWSLAALRFGGNLASADGGEDKVPYTEVGRAAFQNHDQKDDPTSYCIPSGMPRILHSPFPMKIMQDKNNVVFLYEYNRVWRLIDLNRTQHYSDATDLFYGDSIGHWEGDTLVIETTNINDRSWLDTTGHLHTADMTVIEKITRTGPEAIDYEVDVIDPKYYAKPWVHKGTLRPQLPTKGLPELLEYFCTENNLDAGHMVHTTQSDLAPRAPAPAAPPAR